MKNYIKNQTEIWIANIVTAIMCYGYELTNRSIGVDDESIQRALTGRLFETGRFGVNLINFVIDIGNYLPWIYLFICLISIVVGNVILTGFWKIYSKTYDNKVGIIYSIVMVSYPGWAYKFIFSVNLVQMGLVYLAVVVLVCLNYYMLLVQYKKRYIAICIPLYYFLFVNYETAIMFVVILFVYSLFLGDNKYNIKQWIKRGGAFLGIIIVSLLLWKIIEKIVFEITGIIPDKYASSYIQYSSGNIAERVGMLFSDLFVYLQNQKSGVIPFAILLVALLVFIWKNDCHWLVKTIGTIAELCAFSFMQVITGSFNQLPRTCLYLSAFWAIGACSLYLLVKEKIKFLKYLVYVFVILIVLNNSIVVNKVVYCDNIKNELDVQVASNIYKDIQKIDGYKELPVVFIGAIDEYQLPYDVQLGRDSMFRHDIVANNCRSNETINFRLYSYFELLGMPLKKADDVMYVQALEKSKRYSTYPKDGYIGVKDNVIIVKLGECEFLNLVDSNQLTIQSGEVRATLDICEENKEFLAIQGWGYIGGYTSNRVRKYLMLTGKNTGKSYLIRCANTERPDVVDALYIKNSYKWCGFDLRLQKDLLEKDTYDLQILLETGGVYYNTGLDMKQVVIY